LLFDEVANAHLLYLTGSSTRPDEFRQVFDHWLSEEEHPFETIATQYHCGIGILSAGTREKTPRSSDTAHLNE